MSDGGEDLRAVLEVDACIGLVVVCVAVLGAENHTGFDPILAALARCDVASMLSVIMEWRSVRGK